MKNLLYQSLAMIMLASAEAAAADLSVQPTSSRPVGDARNSLQQHPAIDWTGFYIGAHAGIAGGHSSWSSAQPAGPPDLSGSFNFFRPFDVFDGSGSHFGGVTGGYDYRVPSGTVVGVEADISFPGSIEPHETFASPAIGSADFADALLMSGTVRARLGFDANHWLYYVTGGVAWTEEKFTRTQLGAGLSGPPAGLVEQSHATRLGWTVGAGVETPVLPGWTVKAEYLYSQFSDAAVIFPQASQRLQSDLSTHQVRLGLNYQLGGTFLPDWSNAVSPAIDAGDWALHGQTTFVSQYAPPFHAPYRGANSLDSNIGRETWDATLYVGRRLWNGAELWVNPEINQGFGLSNTLGIAGFPSGEAYKLGSSEPYVRLPRAFIRQTIDLGGDGEKVEAGINQFAGTQSHDRLVVTVGKFSVSDVFDTISYAHDPRNDFMNWTLVDAGTFDYAADAWGYTYGAAAEWYRGDWTLRTGLFDLSVVPNSTELDPSFRQFQFVYELEHRHEIAGQPGKLALVGFLTRGRMGRFDEAIALAQQNGMAANTADVRRYASRTGVNVNFEQQLIRNIGFFARAGWADGNIEPYEFTDVDRTASAGLSFNGKLWSRPDDTIGIAGVVNGISTVHQAYFNAGGLGILVGDGQLPHPGSEKIMEAWYSLPLGAWRFTADYQFVANPGYNRDRGPVSIIGARVRTQF